MAQNTVYITNTTQIYVNNDKMTNEHNDTNINDECVDYKLVCFVVLFLLNVFLLTTDTNVVYFCCKLYNLKTVIISYQH